MYQDATEVFFNQQWEFYDVSPKTISFFKRLPDRFLRMFRQVRFIFGGCFWAIQDSKDPDAYKAEWQDVVNFIRDNFDVPKLFITIDNRLGVWETCNEGNSSLDDDDDDQDSLEGQNNLNLWVYQLEREIAAVMAESLHGLRDIKFEVGACRDLEPLLEKEVMGNRYRERRRPLRPETGEPGSAQWELPSWHA